MAAKGDVSKSDSGKAGPVKKAPRSHPPLHSIKHPLQHRWSVWYYINDKKRSWEENQIEVASFDTVEDFWALFTHLEVASKLRSGCDYSLFKYGIKPMWEDSRNQNGGRWLFSLNKSQRTTDFDNYWLEILLCLIGDGFEKDISGNVNGAVLQVRPKFDKLAVWTADVHRACNNTRIGKTLKERLYLPPQHIVPYQAHSDIRSKKGGTSRARYYV